MQCIVHTFPELVKVSKLRLSPGPKLCHTRKVDKEDTIEKNIMYELNKQIYPNKGEYLQLHMK